ncbi:SDR family oxidoreductase [Kitasatospora sp. NPDC058965]|uniref:SDR family oxidoreductase n=1 Tax=Kitasatospora sp. NPDC058965 TaxID=3346682 RepID=UPI0036CED336
MGVHLITGAGSGIGAAVAALLADRGDELWLLARTAARARELRARFPDSRTVVADLTEPAALTRALEPQGLPDRLDSLLHIAGVLEPGTVGGFDPAVWQRTLAVNLLAPGELTRLALPALRAAQGHVVFLNSGAGLHAPPGLGGYAASKFALKALAESLRAEEHRNGLRVTTVYPGEVDTPMQVRLHESLGVPYVPQACLSAASVAAAVVGVLDFPPDGTLSELMIRPGV